MKFGKEFKSQMVPEWQEAYMDYNELKEELKDVERHRPERASSSETVRKAMRRRGSFYNAIGRMHGFSGESTSMHHEDEVILINEVNEEDGLEGYHTLFLRSADEGGESELVFFQKLDVEFNKVLKFYRKKVEELVAEGAELSHQMNALNALRKKVHSPHVDLDALSTYGASFSKVAFRDEGQPIIETLDDTDDERRSSTFETHAPDILGQVKINVTPESPRSILKALFKNTRLNKGFSKEDLKMAEQRLKKALIEFHKKLRLLKSYCFVNQLAFSKIMKKYDKITSRSASKPYLQMVDNSYLGNSDELTKLMERIEAIFIKHFANGNHREGLTILRPKAKRERHMVSFLIGLFSGWSLALVLTIILLIHAKNILESKGRETYMQFVFPLYSFFGFVVVHTIMFAVNTYFWRLYRINYQFIFGFKQGTELGFRELFLISSGITALTLAGVISNLDMDLKPGTEYKATTELVPLYLITLFLLITFCPFNIVYRSSRYFLIQCIFRCLCAPLYKVTFPDFFLADQLTSQVQAFRSMEFYVCYYGWGDYKKRSSKCYQDEVFHTFYFIVAIIPYWCRFFQCLRRLFEEKDAHQGQNAMKYLSTIVAVVMRTGYELKKGTKWKTMAIITSAVATLFNTYWDLFVDWGLMHRNSKNPWLRDKLVVSNKSVYFIAMIVNVILRLAWIQSVSGFNVLPQLHKKAIPFLITCLEIFRRGMWNFFRLENEHLNNVGKFRAFKSVPLPFNYEDEEETT